MAMAAMAMEESERSESQAAVKEKDEREERCAEASARSLCIATGMMITAATLVLPSRPAVILAIKGDRAANTMGKMSAAAAVVELLVNPLLGRLCDHHGRKPFMLMAMVSNTFLRAMSTSMQTSIVAQFLDRMLSGAMIFAFQAPAAAAMADLFAKDAIKLGTWSARRDTYLGIGATIGPLIGSKLGTRQSFAASTLMFAVTSVYVRLKLPETLSLANRKYFKFEHINPVSFLKLFQNKTLGWLATATALQSFGDTVNLLDLNNIFLIKVLHYGPQELGHFATASGLSAVAGGRVTLHLLKKLQKLNVSALKVSTFFANSMWTAGMVSMGLARRTSHLSFAMFLWTFGQLRSNSLTTYLQTYGAAEGLGRAEIVVATANLLAYVKVLAPLLYSNLFSWAISSNNRPSGLPYFVIAAMTLLAQGSFVLAAP